MQNRRSYIRVKTIDGERTRQVLLESRLLDTEHKILQEDGFLYFPLTKRTSEKNIPSDFTEIEYGLGERKFFVVKDGPGTLAEALDDTLTEKELELLPRAYDLIGDIAVIEIPEELQAYRIEIGKAFLQVHSNFETVLAKKSAIGGLTRVREYEYLSGVQKTDTIHIEYGCRIAVDLAKAYFSPRLLEEHNRVASQVAETELVVDLFTGVGPFPLHIARQVNAKIVAIDINPAAIDLLKQSMKMNRLLGTIEPLVLDAYEFTNNHSENDVDRVIMNHPSCAAEFVKDACSILKPGGILHYYDFMGGENPEDRLMNRVKQFVQTTGRTIKTIGRVRRVRDSAPYEYQMVADVILH